MTANQRSRQERALPLVRRRLDFWAECMTNNVTKVDGKTVDPEEKYLVATSEEQNLERKLR